MKAIVNGQQEFMIKRDEQGLTVDGKVLELDIQSLPDQRFHVLHDGLSYNVEVLERNGKTSLLRINGKRCEVALTDRFDELLRKLGMDSASSTAVSDLKASMPGLVVGVAVESGAQVNRGDALVVLEAMKMENVLKSSGDATVKSVKVKQGDTVEKGQVLVEFE